MSFDIKLEYGELVIDSSGDFMKVEKADKLLQDIIKIIVTPLGASKFNPWYGSSNNVVGNVLDINFAASLASSQFRSSLDTLKKMQEIQGKTQFLSPEEQLAAIRQVLVKQNSNDPRFISIAIQVVNKAFQQINPNVSLQI